MAATKGPGSRVSRRLVLQGLAAGAAVAHAPSRAFAAPGEIMVADPRYERFYKGQSGIHAQDPNWLKQTLPRLTWPGDGEMAAADTVPGGPSRGGHRDSARGPPRSPASRV